MAKAKQPENSSKESGWCVPPVLTHRERVAALAMVVGKPTGKDRSFSEALRFLLGESGR